MTDFNKTEDGFEVYLKSEEKETVETCKYLVLAMGRSGNKWFSNIAPKKGIETKAGKIDLGVRVEYNHYLAKDIDSVLYEPKCVIRLPNDVVSRTFCYCPRGEILAGRSKLRGLNKGGPECG